MQVSHRRMPPEGKLSRTKNKHNSCRAFLEAEVYAYALCCWMKAVLSLSDIKDSLTSC